MTIQNLVSEYVYVSLCLQHSGSKSFVILISKETQILSMQGCVEEQDTGGFVQKHALPEKRFDSDRHRCAQQGLHPLLTRVV